MTEGQRFAASMGKQCLVVRNLRVVEVVRVDRCEFLQLSTRRLAVAALDRKLAVEPLQKQMLGEELECLF